MKSLGVKKFKSLLLVSSLQMALSVIAMLSDSVIAGHLSNGENEISLAAIGIVTPLISVMIFISSLITAGTEYQHNFAVGRTDRKRADEMFGMGLLISFSAGISIFLIGTFGIDLYLKFLSPDPKIIFYVHEYFAYFKFVLLLTPLSTLLNGMVYNDGDELIANAANFMNILGNIIFSVLFAFYFEMGIAGIALGTLLKEIFSIAVLSCHFLKKSNSLGARLFFSFRDLLSFIKYGFVDSGMFLMWGILMFALNKLVIASFGSFYLPVLSVAFAMIEISVAFDGIGTAVIPMAGVYYSEGNFPAVRKIMKSATKIALLEGIIFTVLAFAFDEEIAFFFDIDNPELVKFCASAVRIISLSFTVSSVLYLFETYYTIISKNIISVLSSFLRNLILPVIIASALILTGNISGVWTGISYAQIFALMICAKLLKILYSEDGFPLYLDDEKKVADFDIELSPENILKVQAQAEEFLAANKISRKIINRISLIIEESGMAILENNPGKKILAEYTLILHNKDDVQVIVRDNGKIFNFTDADNKITSFRSFIMPLVMNLFNHRKNFTATGLNRNVFSSSGVQK